MRFQLIPAAALLLGAASAHAAAPDGCVPARWAGGPLEISRRSAVKPLAPELVPILRDWYQPWSLELIQNTPINCLLVTWTGGDTDADREQQRQVRNYAAEARERGIATLGLIASEKDAARAAAAAVEAGLDGLALDSEFGDAAQLADAVSRLTANRGRRLPVIPLQARTAAAPGVRLFAENGAVQATPTSEPWIDSNFWLARLLLAQGVRPVWLGYRLDKPSDDEYARAIADAAAGGGQWVLSPDDDLIVGLARKSPPAFFLWQRIAATLRFFEEHSAWRAFAPTGPLGIVQEPGAANAEMAGENLNLIARRRIPYRLLARSAITGPALREFRAVLALGCMLEAREKEALREFASQGGLLIVGPGWGETVPQGKDSDVRTAGKGRIAIYREDTPDPESLSKDVLYLLGKNNLGLRLFHGVTVLPAVSESGDGKLLLVQMVNYATEPAETLTLRFDGGFRSARLYEPGAEPVEAVPEKSDRGVEVKVPKVSVYAALILEK